MIKHNRKLVVSALLVFVVICFIFSNSLKNGEESKRMSGWVMKLVQSVFDPFHRLNEEKLHYFIRKGAHFSEFALLGASLIWLGENIKKRFGKACPGVMLFLALLVAVADEFIQRFTGRTSSVTDVLIDFSGALTAMLFLWFMLYLFFRRRSS